MGRGWGWVVSWLIDWKVFYTVSAIFQSYNGRACYFISLQIAKDEPSDYRTVHLQNYLAYWYKMHVIIIILRADITITRDSMLISYTGMLWDTGDSMLISYTVTIQK